MSSEEVKVLILTFIDNLIASQNRDYNFDFFFFADVDSDKGSDSMVINTFGDYDSYRTGVLLLDCSMRDRLSRQNMGTGELGDIQNNANLRLLGFDGYNSN